MPLEAIGSYAVAGSTGANARGARQTESAQTSVADLSGFAASSARGGDSGGEEIRLPSSTPNLAVYLSPFIRLDLETRLAIVEFRDSQTGAVKQQYPSPRAVKEYQQNLPETSDLLPKPSHGDTSTEQVRIIGPGQRDSQASAPLPVPVSGTPRPAPDAGSAPGTPASDPTPAPIAKAAAAAFSAIQNVLTGGRQLAVA